jgi:hypothetical protein
VTRSLFDDPAAEIEADIQRELARAKALRHNTDPETSHTAARLVVKHLGDIQKWVLGVVTDRPGCTATELAQAKGIGDPREINRRLSELEDRGRVRRGGARECRVTGRSAATWWAS